MCQRWTRDVGVHLEPLGRNWRPWPHAALATRTTPRTRACTRASATPRAGHTAAGGCAWTMRGCGTRAASCAARHGRGTLRFPPDEYEPGRRGGRDSESDSERSTRRDASRIPRRPDDHDFPVGGDHLAGTFVEGVLHGPAVYHSADGSSRKGTYVHGELTGLVEEFDASGALVFRGDYSDGRRHGDGVLRQPDGSASSRTGMKARWGDLHLPARVWRARRRVAQR